ncbi:Solute carrier family 13 member 5 [Lamellibrachia satsuma]|nr:Solute carrier family 13 member 5 [Lamellibrachia satsuma]
MPVAGLGQSPASRCAYIILLMATYWVTEALPSAVTALLPMCLMPYLSVASAKDMALNYFSDTNFLFLGGLMVAIAVEKCNLHKRLALRALLIAGSKPQRLMLGFMFVTAFMSMWISNTATAAMMVPIVHSVLEQLRVNLIKAQERESIDSSENDNPDVGSLEDKQVDITVPKTATEEGEGEDDAEEKEDAPAVVDGTEAASPADVKQRNSELQINVLSRSRSLRVTADKKSEKKMGIIGDKMRAFDNFSRAMRLSVAYAANVGGTATITGSPTNLVAKEMLDILSKGEYELSFLSWFVIAFPNSMLSLMCAWIWLIMYNMGPRFFLDTFIKDTGDAKRTNDEATNVLREEYKCLGKMTFGEKAVLVHFLALTTLWFTRNPGFIKGWSVFFKPKYITDGTVGITVALSLFVFPSRMPSFTCFSQTQSAIAAPGLLDWPTVKRKMAWNVILLMGGGFALADACGRSGLSKEVGRVLNDILLLPPKLTIFVLCLLVCIFSEVTSNTTTNTLFLQVLGELAKDMGINPLYLMLPVTICASCAFMLPVATPPNAIVFSYGDNLRIIDMIKSGWMMNLMCVTIVQLGTNTWAYAWFDYGTMPDWAKKNANATTMTAP